MGVIVKDEDVGLKIREIMEGRTLYACLGIAYSVIMSVADILKEDHEEVLTIFTEIAKVKIQERKEAR